ncbi:MAG: hypothetical protein ACK5GN_00315 [Pseudomonadota bacterium]
MPVKLARRLLDITIGCCFDSHPRIDSVLQNSGFRYELLENAIVPIANPERVFFSKITRAWVSMGHYVYPWQL